METVDRAGDYERETYEGVDNAGVQGDIFCIVQTVDGKTSEVLIPMGNVFRVTIIHDGDVVAAVQEHLEKIQEEAKKEEDARRARELLTLPGVTV